MSRLVALACPVCAAPFEIDADKCQYCGAVIFVKPETPRVTKPNLERSVAQEHLNSFRARIRRDSYDAEAHYGLGVVYYNLGLYQSAADELTNASRLMPESPAIQLQVAIVYHEIMRSGDDSVRNLCAQAISNTLLLDPKNTAALALRAELLTDDQDFYSAAEVVDRLNQLDAEAAAESLKYLRSAEVSHNMLHGDWNSANTILNLMDNESIRSTLTGVLEALQPLVLYPVNELAMRSSERSTRVFLTILAGIVGLFLFSGLEGNAHMLLAALAAGVTFMLLTRRMESNRINRRVEIDLVTIESARWSTPSLKKLARALTEYQKGQMVNEQEFRAAEEEQAQSESQNKNTGCSGCLWPN